jgi:sigma-54 specific flagellar transcriptional regulator A
MAIGKLSQTERKFVRAINDVVCINPFSTEREEILARLNPYIDNLNNDVSDEDHVFFLLKRPLEEFINNLYKRNITTILDVENQDRSELENIFIYTTHLRYLDEMDELIQAHLNEKDKPIKVTFGPALIKDLLKFGFSEELAYRGLSVLYQIRRAYYFIGRELVGNCPSMKALRCSLWNNVFTFDIRYYKDYLWNHMEDFSTLILGDTGTGKSSAAKAIGQSGLMHYDPLNQTFTNKFSDSYMLINLSEYPETLIESALFGHKKGAFTGAIDNFSGIFNRCLSHGILFLDEIGEVPESIQVKLLNVLQDRIFTPIGSHKTSRFKGRVITATSKSLEELRTTGKMRDDLFYRLSSDIIIMPSLQQRVQENADELRQLIHLLVHRMTDTENPKLADWVCDLLNNQIPKHYPWFGNVRELEQAVRRIILKQQYVGAKELNFISSKQDNILKLPDENIDAKQLLTLYCQLLYKKHGTYQKVANIVNLDRRTVTKYIQSSL